MRLLANENFPKSLVTGLRARGHDVAWVREDAPGATDPKVLERARAEGRIVATFDKDFGELAFRQKLPASSGVILVRLKTRSPALLVERCLAALDSRKDWAGNFAVVSEDQIRMRPLP